jgi:hypothetical protein
MRNDLRFRHNRFCYSSLRWIVWIALLKLVLSRHFMQCPDGRQGSCGETSQPDRQELSLPRSLSLQHDCGYARSLPAAGSWRSRRVIGGGSRHLPTGTVREGLGRRPHNHVRVVIKPVETSAPVRRTRTIVRWPAGLKSALVRAQTGRSEGTTFRVFCRDLTRGRQPFGWAELGQPSFR